MSHIHLMPLETKR